MQISHLKPAESGFFILQSCGSCKRYTARKIMIKENSEDTASLFLLERIDKGRNISSIQCTDLDLRQTV